MVMEMNIDNKSKLATSFNAKLDSAKGFVDKNQPKDLLNMAVEYQKMLKWFLSRIDRRFFSTAKKVNK